MQMKAVFVPITMLLLLLLFDFFTQQIPEVTVLGYKESALVPGLGKNRCNVA